MTMKPNYATYYGSKVAPDQMQFGEADRFGVKTYVSPGVIADFEALGVTAREQCRSRNPGIDFNVAEREAFQRGWDRQQADAELCFAR